MEKKRHMSEPIFMIGMPRSGTSALSEAISLHEKLGWFSNYLNKYPTLPILSLLDRVTTIPGFGWNLRGKKKQEKSLTSRVRRYLPYSSEANNVWETYCGDKFLWDYLISTEASPAEKAKIKKYINFVLVCQGKDRFFTKFTGPPKIYYLSSIFPKAFFIHVLRDPRGVVSSLLNVKFWKKGRGDIEPWWKNGLKKEYLHLWETHKMAPAALAAVQWNMITELTWQEKSLLNPKQFVEIRYEDFVQHPHEILSEILSQVGLEDSHIAHKYLNSFGSLKNMNFKYKRLLTKEEIKIVEEITNPIASKAGYHFS